MPRIVELDALLIESARARAMFREAHPELSFASLAGGEPMRHPKKSREGFAERLELITHASSMARSLVADAWLTLGGDGLARDDVLDAAANALMAFAGTKRWRSLPPRPPRDSQGLPMRIVYADLS